ncbi:MAG TPA: hypothetical protein VN622_02050 [Clostridia bacterium]|nr:hypothetical protein [Clostridia bacterium]
MTSRKHISLVFSALLVLGLGASVPLVKRIDRAREATALQEVLYIPSANTVKRMSLGYTGLLADVYWTRVVQYFGGKHHERALQFKLLEPLLDITTTLDPHLMVAYEFGSIFLAQQPPEGAGDPQAAIKLVERGIRENPAAWRLYYHLGFIYWQELGDSKKASEVFLRGSEIPGALPWMKVMAATFAQHAGDAEISRLLWTKILESTEDKHIRANAIKRLRALRVDEEVTTLQQWVDNYARNTGRAPASFQEMVAAGYLKRLPVDPLENPYQVRGGRVEVAYPDDLPFITKGLPPGRKASVVPSPESNK